MNSVLDNALVGLALLVSAGYAVSSLGPKSVRRRLLGVLGRAAARAPAYFGLRRMSQRLAAASMVKAQGACGGCDNCGAEEASASKPGSQNSPAPDVRVPLAKIGRRN